MLMLAEQDPQSAIDYEGIIAHYAPMIRAYCGRELCPADADDATQAVFLVLWKKAPTLDPSLQLSSWLFGVARNVVRNARRDAQRRRKAEQGAGEEAAMYHSRATEDQNEEQIRQLINQVIEDLPRKEREAVELYYLAGHTYAEIAAHTNSKTSTVAAKVQRGLERMRSLMKKRGLAVPLLLISGILQAATEPVSTSLLHKLNTQAPSANISAMTTPEIPVHILRWSQQGSKLMTSIYSGLTVCLLTAGIFLFAQGAEQNNQATGFDDIGDVAMDMSIMFRFNNPSRSIQRFADSPYGALIKIPGHEFPKEMYPGSTYGWLAMDPNSLISKEHREKLYDLARKQVKAPTEDYFNVPLEKITDGSLENGLDENAGLVMDFKGQFDVSNEKIMSFLFERYEGDENSSILAKKEYSNGSYLIDRNENNLRIHSWNINSANTLAKVSDPKQAQFPEADIEFYSYAHPLNEADFAQWFGQEQAPYYISKGSLSFSKNGLKVFMQSLYPAMPQRPDIRTLFKDTPTISMDSFSRIPNNAVIAFAVGRSIKSPTVGMSMIQMLTTAMKDSPLFANNSITDLLPEIASLIKSLDGDVIGYVQMGAMIPEITLILPCSIDQSVKLISQTKKCLPTFSADSDDVTVRYFHAFGNVSVGHRGNHLYITTNALGIDHVHQQEGGFEKLPEIQSALAHLNNPTNGQVIIRDKAIGAFLKPFLAMQADDIKTTGVDIIDSLPDQAGYLRWYENQDGMTIEGDGALNVLMLPVIVPAAGELLNIIGNS